ncbi:MAG: hypothetical protein ACYDIC_12850 [Desulfobaccales bacterium]
MLADDVEKLLIKFEPDSKKAVMTFRLLHRIGVAPNEIPICHGDGHKEVMMTMAEGDYKHDPYLLALGIWEMALDFPMKLSG